MIYTHQKLRLIEDFVEIMVIFVIIEGCSNITNGGKNLFTPKRFSLIYPNTAYTSIPQRNFITFNKRTRKAKELVM